MEDVLTILIICRPHGIFKWVVNDGLVTESFGTRDENIVSEPCPPREFLARNRALNLKNSGMDKVFCAQTQTRYPTPDGPGEYRWVIDERLF